MKKRLLISGMIFLCIITVIGILVCRKVWLHEMRQNRQLSQLSSLETKIEENIVGQQAVAGAKRVTSAMENYEFDLDSESIFEGQNSDEEMGDYQICFYSKAEEFDKCVIGKGKGKYSGMYVVVTEDKLQVYYANGDTLSEEYDISFNVKDYIAVNIIANLKERAEIQISTNGSFESYNVAWSGRMGNLFVETGKDTILSDCELSYYANGWNKPIWLFGDSYFNCNSPQRWTSYLVKNGYNNIMLNGYPGRGSDDAMKSLKNMLKYAVPDEIIWCMGMNDKDSEDMVNERWQSNVNELIEICGKYNITLVLSTIPNCPTIHNEFKNQFVKESGFRYIDFANAVGSYENVNWYEGMLESGGERCHPTESGAVALYHEAVVKCPELLGK